ncbi:E3 ubiquitin-protein ligase FANCL-like [Saccostrea echinata]|uniref:E3 ubiquitin-protein ligase FANCL-like n=1 Tax=Saccostrea echinata TaxID=191078 RepID=UPI002A803F43|nr:E3 ubiquitin-protein ligase FANCL-like [Saccostrea echinata]
MLRKFPCLLPKNFDFTEYDGYIQILDKEYRMNIKLPEDGKLTDAKLTYEWKLEQILKKYDKILKQRLAQCENLPAFLEELRSIAEKQISSLEQNRSATYSNNCAQLISELEKIGWERVTSVDADFQSFQIKYTDEKQRPHLMKIKLHSQHPRQAPAVIVDLPAKFDVVWTSSSTLLDLFNQFIHNVELYQDLWNNLGELDQKTWVLEPDNPTFAATNRRIAISASASVQIAVDPKHPCTLPEIKFMGSNQATNPLRENMTSNLHLWNENDSILTNLSTVLNVAFPSPSDSKKEDFSADCGICYSYRLGMEIPEEVCNDSRCGQPFHQTCLIEWLRGLPSCRQSFNTIFGECPYCGTPITVKMSIKV